MRPGMGLSDNKCLCSVSEARRAMLDTFQPGTLPWCSQRAPGNPVRTWVVQIQGQSATVFLESYGKNLGKPVWFRRALWNILMKAWAEEGRGKFLDCQAGVWTIALSLQKSCVCAGLHLLLSSLLCVHENAHLLRRCVLQVFSECLLCTVETSSQVWHCSSQLAS